MKFLKKLLGGSGSASQEKIFYVYVRPKMCREILAIRIRPLVELSLQDDGKSYIVRKISKSVRCPFEVEVTLYFDSSKNITDQQVKNGEFVTESDFIEWESKNTRKSKDQ